MNWLSILYDPTQYIKMLMQESKGRIYILSLAIPLTNISIVTLGVTVHTFFSFVNQIKCELLYIYNILLQMCSKLLCALVWRSSLLLLWFFSRAVNFSSMSRLQGVLISANESQPALFKLVPWAFTFGVYSHGSLWSRVELLQCHEESRCSSHPDLHEHRMSAIQLCFSWSHGSFLLVDTPMGACRIEWSCFNVTKKASAHLTLIC